tara:strand:- start:482 stop:652 length:171 start_codon:yes stop_codon:yes gene_type:complete
MMFSEIKEYQPIGNGWNRAKIAGAGWVNIHDTELAALATGNKDLLPKEPLPPIPRP